jgi:WD40 repeat protein
VRTHRPLGKALVAPSAEALAGYSFAFQPHGNLLASVDFCGIAEGCDDLKFILWDVRAQERVGRALLSCSDPVGLAFRKDGRVIATACGKEVRFWDVRTHKQIGEPLEVSGLRNLVFSPDGHILATASGDKTVGGDRAVRLWNIAAVRSSRSAGSDSTVRRSRRPTSTGSPTTKSLSRCRRFAPRKPSHLTSNIRSPCVGIGPLRASMG